MMDREAQDKRVYSCTTLILAQLGLHVEDVRESSMRESKSLQKTSAEREGPWAFGGILSCQSTWSITATHGLLTPRRVNQGQRSGKRRWSLTLVPLGHQQLCES